MASESQWPLAKTMSDLLGRLRDSSAIVQVGCATTAALALTAVWKSLMLDRKTPPRYNPGIPLLGGTIAFLKDPLEFIAAGYKAKGGVFQMNIFTKQFCFLVGPEAQSAFFDNSDAVLDQTDLYKFSVPVFGPGVVFDVDYPIRKQQLGFVRDRFGLRHMDSYVGIVEAETKPFIIELLTRNAPINIRKEMFELLMRTSTSILMGADVREMLSSGVAEYLHDLEQGMQSYSVFAPYAPTQRHRKRDAARHRLGELFTEVLAKRRNAGAAKSKSVDIIDKLLSARYSPSGKALTDEEITGLCIASFFGGMHNSAITSAWTLLYISHYKDICARLQAEQIDARKCLDPNAPLTYKELRQMPLLKACVQEAVRLRPPLVLLMRTVKMPITVCGYKVNAGTVVAACPPVAHRIPEVYPDPDAFNPDRWLEAPESSLKPHSFIAFGDGARRCLGETLGYLQVMTVVSHVLSTCDMELMEGVPAASFQGMVVGPEGNCSMKLKHRV